MQKKYVVGFSFYQLSTFAVICYFDFSLTFFLMSIRVDLTFSSFSICNFNLLNFFSLIAELAECSPIIIQNSSNPASRKNLDVQPYKVLLLTCMVNCTVGTPTPRLCPVVQWSVHWALSWTTRGLVLARARRCALETCEKKKVLALLLDLAKSIYYLISQCFFFSLILAPTNQLQLLSSFFQRLENCPVKIVSRYCHMFQSFCSKWVVQLIPYLCVCKGV